MSPLGIHNRSNLKFILEEFKSDQVVAFKITQQ